MMNYKIKEKEWALGLLNYTTPSPNKKDFSKLYTLVLNICKEFDIEITYMGVDGPGHTEKLKKINSRANRALVSNNFYGIHDLGLCANPQNSDKPAFDRFFSIAFGYISTLQEVCLSLTMNEGIVDFGSNACEILIAQLLDFHPWSFGFSFTDNKDNDPEFHILGASNGKLSQEEENALALWYSTTPEDRMVKARSVYPYNFVNAAQLGQPVSGSLTLKDFIINDPRCTLSKTKNNNLYLWKVEINEVENVKAQLSQSDALIVSTKR